MSVQTTILQYLDRIARFNAPDEGLNAVLCVDPDALSYAAALDRKPASERGALYGSAFLLKDNVATAGRLPTTAGSLALKDHYTLRDAFVAKRIREEDGVIFGKANMTEFANFLAQGMPGGYSSLGGQVKNAHNPSASPSGSSSGSAVAVAAGFCDAAVGTETAGSILAPSQVAGVVGLKPTLGLVSRSGIVPISPTLDTAGPIARTVADAAKLLCVMAGYDPADPATHVLKYAGMPDLSLREAKKPLREWRVGVNRGGKPNDVYVPHADALLRLLRESGATLVDVPAVHPTGRILPLMRYEFHAAMDCYLAEYGKNALVRSAEDIMAFNLSHASEALAYGQARLEESLRGATGRMTDPEYLDVLSQRARAQENLLSSFDEADIDVMVFMAGATDIAPFTGFPAATIPIGRYEDNVPVGSYFVARPFDDARLLSFLSVLEAEIHNRGMFTL